MTAKRKISIRKVLQVFTTLVVTTCCIIAMVSASKIEDNKTVKSVSIVIRNDKKYHFIEQQEIMDIAINNRNVDVEHIPLSRLDVHGIEDAILADPWVANAQVFIDNAHVLNINVTQRVPVARLFQQNSVSYYLDSTLSIMPLSKNYIYYTTVVTNVPELKNDSASWTLRKQIVSMVKIIQADTFWNSQVSQLIVDSANMFELTPVLGDQRIILGSVDGAKTKLNNLFLFYKNVLNRIGWDKYEVLDVRFADQVVASPSLPYKGPVDKAVDKMNWINSIVETEALNDSKDSIKTADTKRVKENGDIAAAKVEAQKPVVEGAKEDGKKQAHAAKEPTKLRSKADKAKEKDKKAEKKKEKKANKQENKKQPKYLLPENKNH